MKSTYIILTFFLVTSTFASNEKVLRYEKAIGKDVESISWTTKKEKAKTTTIIKGEKGTTTIEYAPDHSIINYSYNALSAPPPTYTIERKDNVLISSTKGRNKNMVKEYKIGRRAWIQHFGSGLTPFVLSDKDEQEFMIFSPKRQSWHELVAKKKAVQKITVNGKKYEAQKVKVSLDGFFSMFWKAELWFDKTTGELLMETSNEGPKTPHYLLKILP